MPIIICSVHSNLKPTAERVQNERPGGRGVGQLNEQHFPTVSTHAPTYIPIFAPFCIYQRRREVSGRVTL